MSLPPVGVAACHVTLASVSLPPVSVAVWDVLFASVSLPPVSVAVWHVLLASVSLPPVSVAVWDVTLACQASCLVLCIMCRPVCSLCRTSTLCQSRTSECPGHNLCYQWTRTLYQCSFIIYASELLHTL